MEFFKLDEVKVMIDVIGFGLLGYLKEVCEGLNLWVEVNFVDI